MKPDRRSAFLRTRPFLTAMAAAVLLAACGGGQPPEPRQESESPAQNVEGPAPTIDIQASHDKRRLQEDYALRWSSEHADECRAEGDWSGEQDLGTEGEREFTAEDTGLRRYILRCRGPGGETEAEARVMVLAPVEPDALSEVKPEADPVTPPKDAPSRPLSLTVEPEQAGEGDTVTLRWTSAEGGTCIADGDWSGARDVEGEAQVELREDRPHRYRLVCVGVSGHERAEVEVRQ